LKIDVKTLNSMDRVIDASTEQLGASPWMKPYGCGAFQKLKRGLQVQRTHEYLTAIGVLRYNIDR